MHPCWPPTELRYILLNWPLRLKVSHMIPPLTTESTHSTMIQNHTPTYCIGSHPYYHNYTGLIHGSHLVKCYTCLTSPRIQRSTYQTYHAYIHTSGPTRSIYQAPPGIEPNPVHPFTILTIIIMSRTHIWLCPKQVFGSCFELQSLNQQEQIEML